ncbi:MAG: c-type cytochrome [Myxococcota bacterium]
MLLALTLLLSGSEPAWAIRPGGKTLESCQACHDGGPAAPRLDGLSRSYLTRQIQSFNRGERGASASGKSCDTAALKPLTPADYLAVVDVYSAFSPVPEAREGVAPELLAKGEALFQTGRLASGIQACAVCHGHDATGGVQRGLESAAVAPRLAGQDRAYLKDQLLSFRKGVRANDFNGIMRRMVLDLSDADFDALAAYLATLDPATVAPAATDATVALPDKAALCQACHGVGGESMMETFPKIGGLSKGHIRKQLHDIRAGKRAVDVMTPIALALTDAEIDAIAAYFSQFEMHRGPWDPMKARRGEALFHNGNLVSGYPACMYCHGADGKGISGVDWAPGDVPRLAGQHPGYVKKALNDFRSGARKNDHASLMRNIAVRMTDQEIDDVAHFVYSLGERPPATPAE